MRCDHHPFDEEIAYLRQDFPRVTRDKPRLCEFRRGKPRICFPASTAFRFDVIASRAHPPALDENSPTASTPSVKFDPQNILNSLPWQGKNPATRLMAKAALPFGKLPLPAPRAQPDDGRGAGADCRAQWQTKTPLRQSATAGLFGAIFVRSEVHQGVGVSAASSPS